MRPGAHQTDMGENSISRMTMGRKYSDPKFIVLWCMFRYMAPQDRTRLLDEIKRRKRLTDRQLLDHVGRVLDLERLRTAPVAPLDILVYNYLTYGFEGKFKRSALLSQYRKEVMDKSTRADEAAIQELKDWLLIGETPK